MVKQHKQNHLKRQYIFSLLVVIAGILIFSGSQAQPPNPVETDTLAPFVTSTTISSFTATTATLGGNVTGNGGATVTERGIVYSATNTLPTVGDTKVIMGNGNGPYSQLITGLMGGTTYYVRAYAINIIGTSYGAVVSFTTNASPPVVTTNEASSIANTSATVGGNISFSGGAAVTERGVVYSTSNTIPTVADAKLAIGSGTGLFSQSLSGLTQGSIYYLRAYAINSAGTSYGSVISFTPAGATVSTDNVTGVTTNAAILGGNVTSLGSSAVTEKGIVYTTGTGIPTTADIKIAAGNGLGIFSQTISSLSPATTYSARAFATNSTATNYGAVQTFTTQTTLNSIKRVGTVLTNSIVVTYIVEFAQSITGLTTSNFSLTSTGVNNPYVTAVSGSGTTWNVTAYSGTGNGTVTLNLANSNGINPGISNTLPFAGETFTIDRVAPSLTSVSISSVNPAASQAKTGDTVKVSFTANEAIATPVVTIAGNAATLTNTSGNSWIASYVLTATDAEGNVPFNINFSDIATNAGAATQITTDNSAVVFDRTAPIVNSINRLGNSPTNAATVQFSVNFSEPVTGVDAADFIFSTTQAITRVQISSVTGSGSTYTVTVNTGTETGTIRLDLKATGTGIADAAGNLSGGFTTGQVYSILRKPILKINNPTAVCVPVAIDLTDPAITNGSDAGLTYSYFSDAAATITVTSPATIGASGTYYIVGTNVLGTNSDPAAVVVTINSFPKPTVAFSFDSYCINKPVSFANQSTSTVPVNYVWTDNAGNSATTASPTFTYTTTGNYSVKLKVSSQACPLVSDSITHTIGIVASDLPARLPAVNAYVNEALTLQARSIGTSYQWLPATGLSSAAISNPTVTTSQEIQYTIKITAASGCQTVDTLLVRIFDRHLYVPNVFSPNGDGINDVLYINAIRLSRFNYFRVFNRYGKKLFETNNPAFGWDGKLNGQLQPVDTYVWMAEAIDNAGVQVNAQGTVTLLR